LRAAGAAVNDAVVPTAPAPVAVLWDIDGTLLRARGAGARCFRDALADLGHEWPTERIDFGGRTDRDIATALLQAGHPERVRPDDATTVQLLRLVESLYEQRELEYAAVTEALPNVPAVVELLAATAAVQSVVTGNVESIARRKLSAVGLVDALRLDVGAYGDDHTDRHHLVSLSIERVAAAGHDLPADRCWIIGDTPRDLAAARTAGVRCALVATGTFGYDELAALDADVVVADLTAVDALLAAMR
jgi:phosphoglycolate phosphatase